jgi:hypothetical protein
MLVYEEKNRGLAKNKTKYFGKISFESKILDMQDDINYQAPSGPRFRVIKTIPVETIQQPAIVYSTRTSKVVSTPIGNNIVIFAPAFTFNKETIDTIKSE